MRSGELLNLSLALCRADLSSTGGRGVTAVVAVGTVVVSVLSDVFSATVLVFAIGFMVIFGVGIETRSGAWIRCRRTAYR